MVYNPDQRAINRINVMMAIIQHQYNHDIERLAHESDLVLCFYNFVNNKIKNINEYVSTVSSLSFYISYINIVFYEMDSSLATIDANEIFPYMKRTWRDMRGKEWYVIETKYYHRKYIILLWSIRRLLNIKDLLLTIRDFI